MKQIQETMHLDPYLEEIFAKDGPDPGDFEAVLSFIDGLKPEHIESFRKAMEPILNPGTIIGFSYTKPFGYNGDFFIIEKIYQRYVNPDRRYRKWDEFFHLLPAAKAVVNRKKLAIEMLTSLNGAANGEKRRVLILGSGPVTEVNEYLRQTDENYLHFDLVDLDQRAIDYASKKNQAYSEYLRFFNRNAIRFSSDSSYDLIWSAGLFDYFKDKHFVFLIKRYYENVSPGGQMVIGNFNTLNPSRKIMEVLGDWFLYHRSEDELLRFASQAGVPAQMTDVLSEELGINLFLRMRKPTA